MEDKIELEGILENGYGIIPKKIMKDNTLSIHSRAIYAYLCSFSGKGKDVFPSRNKMCYDLNISNDTLGKYIKELKDRKLIEVKQEKNNGKFANNVYKINMCLPIPKFSDTVFSDTKRTDTVEIDTNNNIYSNNNKSNKKKNIQKEKYGEFENVLLTKEEYEKIKNNNLEKYINKLSIYIESKGTKYKSHYATILNWSRKEKEQNKKESGTFSTEGRRFFT